MSLKQESTQPVLKVPTIEIDSTFQSYEEFQERLNARSVVTGEVWVKGDCKTVERANAKLSDERLHFPKHFQYAYVEMTCRNHGKYVHKGKQERKRVSCKMECPAKIRLYANRNENMMVVSKCELTHNHSLDVPTKVKPVVQRLEGEKTNVLNASDSKKEKPVVQRSEQGKINLSIVSDSKKVRPVQPHCERDKIVKPTRKCINPPRQEMTQSQKDDNEMEQLSRAEHGDNSTAWVTYCHHVQSRKENKATAGRTKNASSSVILDAINDFKTDAYTRHGFQQEQFNQLDSLLQEVESSCLLNIINDFEKFKLKTLQSSLRWQGTEDSQGHLGDKVGQPHRTEVSQGVLGDKTKQPHRNVVLKAFLSDKGGQPQTTMVLQGLLVDKAKQPQRTVVSQEVLGDKVLQPRVILKRIESTSTKLQNHAELGRGRRKKFVNSKFSDSPVLRKSLNVDLNLNVKNLLGISSKQVTSNSIKLSSGLQKGVTFEPGLKNVKEEVTEDSSVVGNKDSDDEEDRVAHTNTSPSVRPDSVDVNLEMECVQNPSNKDESEVANPAETRTCQPKKMKHKLSYEERMSDQSASLKSGEDEPLFDNDDNNTSNDKKAKDIRKNEETVNKQQKDEEKRNDKSKNQETTNSAGVDDDYAIENSEMETHDPDFNPNSYDRRERAGATSSSSTTNGGKGKTQQRINCERINFECDKLTQLVCSKCEREFACGRKLRRHWIKEHGSIEKDSDGVRVKLFLCRVCNKRFPTVFSYKVHYRLHTKSYPHTCSECVKRFRSFDQLQIHMTSHKQKFSCLACLRLFVGEKRFNEHMMKHSQAQRDLHESLKAKNVDTSYVTSVIEREEQDETFDVKVRKDHHPETDNTATMRLEHKSVKNGLQRLAERYDFKCDELTPTICSACDMRFSSHTEVRKHWYEEHYDKLEEKAGVKSTTRIFKCDKCDMKTSQIYQMRLHYRIHTGARPHVCTICNQTFRIIKGLREHLITHREKKNYSCPVCSRLFISMARLKVHMKRHNSGRARPYKCNDCEKAFMTRYALQGHIVTHTGERSYICDTCGLRFGTDSGLRIHARTHKGLYKYICDVCGHKFNTNNQLKDHRRKHTGERPYKCTVCNYSCSASSQLKNHILTHGNERPFACQVPGCSRRFKRHSHVNAHHKIHHPGVKPYKCDSCSETFLLISDLKFHYRASKCVRKVKILSMAMENGLICEEAVKHSIDRLEQSATCTVLDTARSEQNNSLMPNKYNIDAIENLTHKPGANGFELSNNNVTKVEPSVSVCAIDPSLNVKCAKTENRLVNVETSNCEFQHPATQSVQTQSDMTPSGVENTEVEHNLDMASCDNIKHSASQGVQTLNEVALHCVEHTKIENTSEYIETAISDAQHVVTVSDQTETESVMASNEVDPKILEAVSNLSLPGATQQIIVVDQQIYGGEVLTSGQLEGLGEHENIMIHIVSDANDVKSNYVLCRKEGETEQVVYLPG